MQALQLLLSNCRRASARPRAAAPAAARATRPPTASTRPPAAPHLRACRTLAASRAAADAKSASRNKASIGKEKANKNRLFNADDIKDLKDSAFIGERSDGELAILPKGIGDITNATPDQIKLAEAIVDEENKDRSVIWKSSLSEDANLTEKDLPSIQEKFAREIYEKSPSGQWFYAGSRWTVKQ